jgi:diguanylate cyclase (GGDEF)-like protein
MELREYLRVLLKSLWLILALALVGVTVAFLFSYVKPPVYEATSSYVVKVDPLDNPGNMIYAMGQLTTSQQRMFATFCQVMMSQAVRDEAYRVANVDPASAPAADYPVLCNVLPDTNVIRLTTQGSVPALVARINDATGTVVLGRAKSLYPLYYLEQLDSVSLAKDPISPSPWQNAVLGGTLGAVLGLALGLLIEYLRSPRERLEAVTVREPSLGIYNERFFQQRLAEEINRARARHHPLSLALMRLIADEDFGLLPQHAQDALLRSAALRMQDMVRDGDVIAYLRRNLFGLLLVETGEEDAQVILSDLHDDLRAHTFRVDDNTASFTAHTGVVESRDGALSADAMLAKATEALRTAMHTKDGAVQVAYTTPQLPAGSTASASNQAQTIRG